MMSFENQLKDFNNKIFNFVEFEYNTQKEIELLNDKINRLNKVLILKKNILIDFGLKKLKLNLFDINTKFSNAMYRNCEKKLQSMKYVHQVAESETQRNENIEKNTSNINGTKEETIIKTINKS
jgi:hypothetical protein